MIGIYKIINPKGKIYIGQSIDIKNRWEKYQSNNCKSQPHLYNSLKKYGYKNHIKEILEECLIDQLNEKETFYKIQYLNKVNGDWSKVLFCELYDTGGGPKSEATRQKMSKPKPEGFGFGKKHSKEAKAKMSAKRYTEEQKNRMRKPKLTTKKGKEHGNFGKEKSEQHINNLKQPILQFDLNGNFIKEWDSVTEANIFLGKIPNASSISLCLVGKYKKAFKYIWKYKNLNEIPIKIETKFDSILQLNLEGEIVGEFLNPTIAQNKTGINSGAIWFCLKGKTKTSCGFKWKYK